MDLTKIAVINQLKAFSLDQFEIGIKCRETGLMKIREMSFNKVIKSIGWLKSENKNGSCIFIRPHGLTPFVFIDDIAHSTVQKMKQNGLNPAVLLESSPLNYQGWVRLSEVPLNAHIATCTAKILAGDYDGDFGSADWRHFGRLAGFTNRKAEHFNGRNYPFVKLSNRNGKIAEKADQLITRAVELAEKEKLKTKPRFIKNSASSDNLKPFDFFNKEMKKLQSIYGSAIDYSRADWAVAGKMYQANFSYDQVYNSMLINSPNLEERRKNHVDDYIQRTLNKIFGIEKEESQN